MRSKKFIFSLVAVTIIALLGIIVIANADDSEEVKLAGFNQISDFYASNRYTYPTEERVAKSQQELDYGKKVTKITTDLGDVYVDEETLNFQIESSTGYVWSSTINYDELTNALKNKVASAVSINFIDTTNDQRTDYYSFDDKTCEKTFTEITNGFESILTFNKVTGKKSTKLASLKLVVTFEKGGININIPSDSIKEENDEIKIYSITPYRYLGAVKSNDVPGYMFIPDGIGALIRYKTPYEVANDYENEIYGKNLSFEATSNLYTVKTNGANVYAPVFGLVHGVKQNSLFAIIEEGAEYGTISVQYPTENIPYSAIFTTYQIRRQYTQPMGKEESNTIKLLQTKRNDYDISYTYKVLKSEDSDYVGMAKYYNQYLKEKEVLEKKEQTENITLKLETLGLEKTTGVLFDKSIVMTTFNEYHNFINQLSSRGVKNIVGVFNGFTPDGVSWSAPKYTKISSKLGSKNDIKALNSETTIYYAMDFQKASSKGSGYNTYFDLAKKINDQRYIYQNGEDEEYLLNHAQTKELFNDSVKALDKYDIDNYFLTNMGNLIYSDNETNMTIEDAIEYYHQMIKAKNKKIGLSMANDYMWDLIEDYFDFPLYSSQRLMIDDTVPFLSLVLQDSMNLYSTNANFFAYPRAELLRLIDFNVYPSFIVTNKSSQKLEKTNLNYIYSSKYTDLEDEIIVYYNYVNDALKYVIGQSITDRIIPEVGIVKNIYENGVTIIINYTNKTYTDGNITVSAMSYYVDGGK